MRRWGPLLLIAACTRAPSPSAAASPPSAPAADDVAAIRAEIHERLQRDQEVRRAHGDLGPVDRANTTWLREVVARRGWIDAATFGDQAAHEAWLLVQHADHDVAFQEQVLAEMERLLPAHGAAPQDVAYLRDRVLVNRGQPQRYGTQGSCEGDRWAPRPMEDPRGLDARRASMHLEDEASYVAFASRELCGAR